MSTTTIYGWVHERRDELRARFLAALQATLFSNRFELRPARFGHIADDEVAALCAFLNGGDAGAATARGAQLCRAGLGEEGLLKLSHAARRFLLEAAPPGQALDVQDQIEAYVGWRLRGYSATRTAVILEEQERIRSAIQATASRYADQMAVAAEVGRATTSILDLDDVLQTSVALIRERFKLYYVAIFLTDDDNRWAYLQVSSGEAGPELLRRGHRLKIGGDSLVGRCIARCECQVALDVGEKAVSFDRALLTEVHSELVIPLNSRGAVIGAMAVQSRHVGAFAEQNLAVLRITADQLANAIANARLFRQRQQQIDQLSMLNELGRALSGVHDAETLLQTIHEQVRRLQKTDRFSIATYDQEHERWTQVYDYRDGQRQPLRILPKGEHLVSYVGSRREPLLLKTRRELATLVAQEHLAPADAALHSWMGAPLVASDTVVGVITLGATRPDQQYGAQDLVLLSTIAAQVAVALVTVRLNEQLLAELRDRARAAEELRASEERYALAARGANDGLWDWHIESHRVYYSPRWKAMLGYEEAEIGTAPEEWLERVHPDDRQALETRLAAHARALISHFECEYRIRHADGDYRWMLARGLAIWDEGRKAVRIAGSQTDITERKGIEQQLMHAALHDPLTGLPNRTHFLSHIEQLIAQAHRPASSQFAILFLDLDRFKIINDSLGHGAGDLLLCRLARRLQDNVRACDTVARLGGDEFTVVLTDLAGEHQAREIAEQIQRALAEPIDLDGHLVVTTGSIGVVVSDMRYTSAIELLRDADTAMYQAKMGGKARAVVFDPAMHVDMLALLQLESELRAALERDELRVWYQPIVALDSEEIVGLEALVRWQHPQRGLLTPADFLTVAEETSLVVPMGWWVLREACRQLAAWRQELGAAHGLWINVNLSAKQLAQPDMIRQLSQILEETGLPASCLKLEITEHTLLAYGEVTLQALQRIREVGVQLCIDDFGTGYSSLGYLQRFPVNVLKIDRSFTSQLGEREEGGEIVQTIIALAEALNLETVAEGIETAEQAETLRKLGCEYGQGWLYARALDAEAAARLLQARQSLGLSDAVGCS